MKLKFIGFFLATLLLSSCGMKVKDSGSKDMRWAKYNAQNGVSKKSVKKKSHYLNRKSAIDRNNIRRVILSNIDDLRSCYLKGLKKDENLKGRLILRWDIEESGRVKNVYIKKNRIKQGVSGCVKRKVAKMKFERPPVGSMARVTYPFNFVSKASTRTKLKHRNQIFIEENNR